MPQLRHRHPQARVMLDVRFAQGDGWKRLLGNGDDLDSGLSLGSLALLAGLACGVGQPLCACVEQRGSNHETDEDEPDKPLQRDHQNTCWMKPWKGRPCSAALY